MRYGGMCVALLLVASPSSLAAERPHIVFILADDHAVEAISCYGGLLEGHAKTPNIDRIAREGVRFVNVFCNNSICSPSRASILTGQYSHTNGARGLNGTIAPGSPWVSVGLQKAGYQTAVFGKWHLQNTPRGFDDYGVTRKQGKYFNPTFNSPRGQRKYEGYATDVYTDVALEWLKRREPSKPFCLMLHFKAPHHPYDYPRRHDKLLEGIAVPEPPSLREDVEQTSPLLKARLSQQMDRNRSYYERHKDDERPPMEPHDPTSRKDRVRAAYQHMIKKYIRCVTAVDDNVGRVLKYLDEEGLVRRTVLIYTSDQGYWLGQHGLYDKRLILEESMRMPLIARYPGEIPPGTICDAMGSNVDFAETLLDFAGAPIPAAMQGRSLRPLMRGGATPADWRRAVFYSYWAGPSHWGVRTERYKLVHFPGSEEIEFYDLLRDPREMKNVAGEAEYSASIAATEKELRRLMREVGIRAEQLPTGRGGKARSERAPRGERKKKRKAKKGSRK